MRPIKYVTVFFLAAAVFLESFSVAGAAEQEEVDSLSSAAEREEADSLSSAAVCEEVESLSSLDGSEEVESLFSAAEQEEVNSLSTAAEQEEMDSLLSAAECEEEKDSSSEAISGDGASALSEETEDGAATVSSVLENESDETLSVSESDEAEFEPEDTSERQPDADTAGQLQGEEPADSAEDGGMEDSVPLFLTASDVQTVSMKAFTYDPSYTSLSFSKADGIAAKTILAEAESIIISQEGNYTSVNRDDNGALSIGRLQWHATRALNLLKTIVSMDNQTAYDTLGDSLYNEIVSADSSDGWSSRTLSGSEASAISDLLGTANGKAAQDALADSDVAVYINQGYSQGITNAAALVYYADIANQYGNGGAKTCGTYAYHVAGKDWSKVKLNELHIAAICYNYEKFSSSNWYTSPYIPRRRTVYKKVVALGWTYCNSGDSTIPYDDYGTTGTAWLQRALNTYQNAGLKVSGDYDSATISAVKKFQKAEGLNQDGYAGLRTSSRLIYHLYYNAAVYGEALPGVTADIEEINGVWTYTEDGVPEYSYTGLAKNSHGWWYVEDGVVTFSYTGFTENEYGEWYCEDSKVTFQTNDVIKDKTGAIGAKGTWYYVVGSKVQTSYTGVADYKNSNGWWYIKKGAVDFSYTGLAKNKNGWWYVEDGKVRFNYTGFAENKNGKWYCEKSKVTFKKNDVIKDTTGAIGKKGTWYYVVGSKVQTSYTGVANYKNKNGWWYIKNGQVDFTANTVAKNKNGWWYVLGGKVQFGYTGLADYKNANGWWYIKNGKVDFSHSGVEKNKNGWWYIKNGKVDFSYNGIAENKNGWWYVRKGKVDFSYTGTVKAAGKTYSVRKGRVNR